MWVGCVGYRYCYTTSASQVVVVVIALTGANQLCKWSWVPSNHPLNVLNTRWAAHDLQLVDDNRLLHRIKLQRSPASGPTQQFSNLELHTGASVKGLKNKARRTLVSVGSPATTASTAGCSTRDTCCFNNKCGCQRPSRKRLLQHQAPPQPQVSQALAAPHTMLGAKLWGKHNLLQLLGCVPAMQSRHHAFGSPTLATHKSSERRHDCGRCSSLVTD